MIAYLRGTVVALNEDAVIVDVNGVGYQVIVPPLVRNALASGPASGIGDLPAASGGHPISDTRHPTSDIGEMTLFTHNYLAVEQSRATPILIGFISEAQREFFVLLASVLSPRTAVRAMAVPIDRIAQAIELGDSRFLKSLPGIGAQKAKELVAKLQGKAGPFLGVVGEEAGPRAGPAPATGPAAEAIDALVALGLRYPEASERVASALRDRPGLESVEEILQAVFAVRR